MKVNLWIKSGHPSNNSSILVQGSNRIAAWLPLTVEQTYFVSQHALSFLFV